MVSEFVLHEIIFGYLAGTIKERGEESDQRGDNRWHAIGDKTTKFANNTPNYQQALMSKLFDDFVTDMKAKGGTELGDGAECADCPDRPDTGKKSGSKLEGDLAC